MVLKYIGKLFAENLRSADILARVGGEEFCVITTNMDPEKAEVLYERLRRLVVKQKISTGKEDITVSISVGVTTRLGETLEATMNQADKLLYQAKETGRNRVVIE
jgi:diguanylate cyclase (GGDEF)-like protein